MRRHVMPVRLALAGMVAAAAVAALWGVPTDSYIFLPNRTHPVAPLVEVTGGMDPNGPGGIYFVDVLIRKATLLERLWPGLREGATVVPARDVRPPGVSESERRREELAEMRRSQKVAAAVALRALGHDVVARPTGARIEFVDPDAPAADVLDAGDVVVRAEGKKIDVPSELRRAVQAVGAGKTIELTVRRRAKLQQVKARTITGPEGTPIIGVIVSQAADIRLPRGFDVEIDSGGVGGPSAGLAFALDVMEELGRDVDHGRTVAVTGSLELDGTVGEIGGVKQKTIAVRRAKIDVFLVPAGENAREAKRYARDLRIVPVKTFQQALRALATLRTDAQD